MYAISIYKNVEPYVWTEYYEDKMEAVRIAEEYHNNGYSCYVFNVEEYDIIEDYRPWVM